jgi:hypothetical protein
LTALGWFPGGVLFPAVIHTLSGPLESNLAGHFVASFWLSGLIALAYSLCGVEFVVLRALYPAMWQDVRQFHETARQELAPVATQLTIIQWLAGSIPPIAAVLLLILGGDANLTLRWLVTSLILLGIVGSHIASTVTRRLSRVVVTMSGGTA